MENMDKGLTVPKLVLINQLKIPQMPQNRFICPNCLSKPKSLVFRWKKASLDNHSPCLGQIPTVPIWSAVPDSRHPSTGRKWKSQGEKDDEKMLKKDVCRCCYRCLLQVLVQPQLLRKVCHIIAKAIAAEMSRKTERKWFVSSSSSSCSFQLTPPYIAPS